MTAQCVTGYSLDLQPLDWSESNYKKFSCVYRFFNGIIRCQPPPRVKLLHGKLRRLIKSSKQGQLGSSLGDSTGKQRQQKDAYCEFDIMRLQAWQHNELNVTDKCL